MNEMITALWQEWSGDSIEYLVLNETLERICVDSAIIRKDAVSPFAARYELICDLNWHVRHLWVSLIGENIGIDLSSDGNGRWADKDGDKPELRGAIDVDIATTPFTNTLPIKRLKLGAGQSADIKTVYISLPQLSVTIDQQRYTCIEKGRLYRFESLDSDFVRDIEVDPDGLVVIYPGLFRRII